MRGYDFLSGVFGVHYTPIFKKICKNNTNAGLLLSQMLYYAKISENHFYKFSKPCNNKFYNHGDSWCELLCFSEKELANAMSLLKELNFITSKKSESFDNRTFYSVNLDIIAEAVTNGLDNTAINEQKPPLKAKTDTTEYKETTEQEKTLKSQDLVLKTEQKTEKSNAKAENKGELVLKTEKSKAKKKPLKYDLPFFVNAEIFENFINHRQEIKKPMTQNAVSATIKKLYDFHAKGYDCNEILINSVANGWQGIFEPQRQTFSNFERTKNVMQSWLMEMEAKERKNE